MHQIKLPHCEVLFVEVPEETAIVKVFAFQLAYKKAEKQRYWETIRLPAYLWELIGITPLTEEQAGEVVEEKAMKLFPDHKLWQNYNKPHLWFVSSISSFASLLTSNSIDPTKRWSVMIKK